jgi:RNA polymerase sigma-70 factor (ECF subfamily)
MEVNPVAEGGVSAAALEEALERCRAALSAMAAARFRNPTDAEDVVQEICVRVLSKAAGYRPEGPLDHWVLSVGANVIRDRARRLRLRNAPIDRPPDEPGLSPHDAVERRETLDRVRRAVDGLESDYRAPLLLYYLHGLEQTRIALLLDITVETLRMRLYRAVRKVREILKESR